MNVTIIGVPYDLDQPYTGMGKAPDALIDAGLPKRLQALGCTTILAEMIDIPATDEPRESRIGQLLTRVGHEVARARAADFFPLVIGGDCMVSIGVLAGLLDPKSSGVLWFDAHGDFNSPDTTVSGYLGGMPLACIVGRGLHQLREHARLMQPVPERNVALVGVRDLDTLEEQALATSSVTVIRADELERDRMAFERTLDRLELFPQLYLHLDIDVLDPVEAPGVDYPAARGLRVAQLQQLLEMVGRLDNLVAVALTAVNPQKDIDGLTVRGALDAIEGLWRSILGAKL